MGIDNSEYYSNGSEEWDIDYLISEAKNIIPKSTLLCHLNLTNMDPYFFSNLKRVIFADLNYPIILAPDGCIIEGIHRVIKALMEGQSMIMCKKFKEMPKPNRINVSIK